MDDFENFSELINDNQLVKSACNICTAAKTFKATHSAAKKLHGYYKNFSEPPQAKPKKKKKKMSQFGNLTSDLKYVK